MTKRVIPPTHGLEMHLNDNLDIVLRQETPYEGKQFVVINPNDTETVRQWLAELYLEAVAEATAGE